MLLGACMPRQDFTDASVRLGTQFKYVRFPGVFLGWKGWVIF